MLTVQRVLDCVWDMAPKELAEEWDNVGLLAGHPNSEVTRILCALDLTSAVIDEAIANGAELIVTHHPILFRGRKNLREDDPEGAMLVKLVRSRIAMIAMHTNYDNAQPGINDALAEALGLSDVTATEQFMRVGNIRPMSMKKFTAYTAEKLNAVVRPYGSMEKEIRRVAVLGGSGGSYYEEAIRNGADAFVTGEIGYHVAMSAVDAGLAILDAGHDCTERVAVKYIVDGLQKRLDALQYKAVVMESTAF